MTDEKLFGFNNLNKDIFIVETEQGQDSDDNMSSMIGDAVMHHVDNLGPGERMLWETLQCMGGQNIFEMVPSFESVDRDPLSLRKAELDSFFKKNKIPESARVLYEEAVQVERERRETSEDAMDRNDGLISYEDWKDNPGLGQHVDLPSTPKPIFRFMGNTTQQFYDEFPEGHQDSDLINQVLMMLNRDNIDDITPKYGFFIKETIKKQRHKPYTREALFNLIDMLIKTDKDPSELVKTALIEIDQAWGREYRSTVVKGLQTDGVFQLLVLKHTEWTERFENKEDVTQDIKSFGKMLFESFHKDMKSSHWGMYKRLKNKFAPKVLIKGIDVNRCRFSLLQRTLGITREQAMRVWFERPWSSVYQVENEGINAETVDQTVVNKVLFLIDTAASTSIRHLARLAEQLVEAQQSGKANMSNIQWNTVWQHYREVKASVLEKDVA